MILRIRNWQKFQHYKDRRPPWVKFHFSTLSSKDWVNSGESDRILMLVCMLISSQSEYMDGRFEADPEFIRNVAHLTNLPNFQRLIDSGFLVEVQACASKRLQTLQNAEPEKRREEKRRDREETPAQTRRVPSNSGKELQDRIKIAARDKRLADEREVRTQVNVGTGPEVKRPIGFSTTESGPAEFFATLKTIAGKS